MYLNTTYKAFVAKAAAGLMQEMVADALANGTIDREKSWDDNKGTYRHLAIQARLAATALAEELQDGWHDGHETVFFDVQDSLTSKLEEAVYDVSEKVRELADEVKNLRKDEEA